ncbi:hypothetical protein H6G97_32515 [Nostoc flagelliforme FACHB-838]|uniref:Transposase n=1 Tax=Nostoc flagelliforme FACHB-838 TaxID=2692904 RepID=A0ABR8DX23_9NOSO|nr:hypothetical protein [Nostoc flagelliforme FACHB-838]
MALSRRNLLAAPIFPIALLGEQLSLYLAFVLNREVLIGTPALPPKPRGKSPGWEPGKKRHRKNRCPIVKKQ